MMPTTSSEPSRLASRAASPPPPDYYQGEGSSIMSQEQPHFHVRDGRDGLEDDSSLVHKARLAYVVDPAKRTTCCRAEVSLTKCSTEAEQSMRLSDAIKTYPKAVAWSLLLSSAIVMEGFDIVLMGSFCTPLVLPFDYHLNTTSIFRRIPSIPAQVRRPAA